ncbi:tRNA-Thr(GGU) m(6)t(6)A37 methyltransferase TsaA [Kribbella amoyensis]|uniref:tRNA-Thr(GGU) m(6)t(6)A37 methyltransferase TsaA n=1 Tax=Kribbella amoyensis TaxID=996641 RepID=A0A561C004_9ACTN|nr:tRNA (N6-threonylcarbamoyladenosine(37)-N6)-methyltransferase TrmO [Kribbella amoyensis]TWD84242.1 tRNA-Thr(GGU) m(6)t(6)A37 methyltransferase TsaA [Kribbella amoyensis]
MSTDFVLRPIGVVESDLTDLAGAPRQGDEGAPDAWLVLDPAFAEAWQHLVVGDELLLFTWFDRADRETLVVHPRSDVTRPPTGVFSTRSPDRPNPIGLHRITLLAIDAQRLHVGPLEAIDGTPVLDLKPVLGDVADR